jgi:hypothetical protein
MRGKSISCRLPVFDGTAADVAELADAQASGACPRTGGGGSIPLIRIYFSFYFYPFLTFLTLLAFLTLLNRDNLTFLQTLNR